MGGIWQFTRYIGAEKFLKRIFDEVHSKFVPAEVKVNGGHEDGAREMDGAIS